MRISVLTLFPDMFEGPLTSSIVGRAQTEGILEIAYTNLRDFSTDAYHSVDDHPYGGGVGMILRVDIIDKAIKAAKQQVPTMTTRTILLDPQGKTYTQKMARELADPNTHLILIAGHYEGVDERVRTLVDEELSIGDYVTTGGELPAMVVIDSVARLLPNVLSKENATVIETFGEGGLEYPQYTRPQEYEGKKVPDILLSGNHQAIDQWRKEQQYHKTKQKRPDLL